MNLQEKTTQFWKMSQHLRAIPVEQREAFLMFGVTPALSQNPLLGRLLNENQAQASA